jgi:long-chain acyl-CoA synthetase
MAPCSQARSAWRRRASSSTPDRSSSTARSSCSCARCIKLVDRQKDMIITSGANVYPRDIEEVAVQHPAVREAAVFGIPDERRGEATLAAVILKQPGAATPEELRQWINERVAAVYQRVHAVVIMEDFPRSVAVKTLKRVMREPYWAEQGTRI